MLVTDKFIFIHLRCTGGTSINKSFKGKMLGYHRPRSLIPEEYAHLPVVGHVRNPFDWYVSLYHHALNFNYPMKTSTFLNFILDFKRYDFKESIKRLLDTSWMTVQDKEKTLSYFPPTRDWNTPLTDNLRKIDCLSYLNCNVGFLSWLFAYMHEYTREFPDLHRMNTRTHGVTYCRVEHLDRDWALFLEKRWWKRWWNQLWKTESFPILNTTSGKNSIIGEIKEPRSKNYMKYYDDELIELIRKKDKAYIERFNYGKKSIAPPKFKRRY